jgi:hypothetical protein
VPHVVSAERVGTCPALLPGADLYRRLTLRVVAAEAGAGGLLRLLAAPESWRATPAG